MYDKTIGVQSLWVVLYWRINCRLDTSSAVGTEHEEISMIEETLMSSTSSWVIMGSKFDVGSFTSLKHKLNCCYDQRLRNDQLTWGGLEKQTPNRARDSIFIFKGFGCDKCDSHTGYQIQKWLAAWMSLFVWSIGRSSIGSAIFHNKVRSNCPSKKIAVFCWIRRRDYATTIISANGLKGLNTSSSATIACFVANMMYSLFNWSDVYE